MYDPKSSLNLKFNVISLFKTGQLELCIYEE